MPKTQFTLVTEFGEMWAKNPENLKALSSKDQGVYVIYDGSMPMHVGMGYVRRRIGNAAKSVRRGEMWDHFSWYVLLYSGFSVETEYDARHRGAASSGASANSPQPDGTKGEI
jgi:hypothetical protein